MEVVYYDDDEYKPVWPSGLLATSIVNNEVDTIVYKIPTIMQYAQYTTLLYIIPLFTFMWISLAPPKRAPTALVAKWAYYLHHHLFEFLFHQYLCTGANVPKAIDITDSQEATEIYCLAC